MHADVPRHTFKLAAEFQEARHLLFVLFALAQHRLHVARHFQRDQLTRLERNQLGDLVAKVVPQIEHAADIAHHRLRRHGAEGGDLRNAVGAIFLAHVINHAIAPVLTEVDVEVGHRNPLGVEEALEQQLVTQGIKVGDAH